jgi:predicted nucleotidyltransferase
MELNDTHQLGLHAIEMEKILRVLQHHLGIDKAIIYGSRAKGNYKPYSDIDITFLGPTLDLTSQNKIEGELDDLLLPYKFDVSIFHKINNKDLINHIHRVGKVIFNRM